MEDLDGKITGDTLPATEWNQLPAELQNIITQFGQSLSSGDLNQVGKSIAGYVANGNFYTDSGIADAYVLSKVGTKQSATSYTNGFTASFIAGNSNTGASTVNITGLGVVNIKNRGGSDPRAGDINGRVIVVYDSSNSWFELINPKVGGTIVNRPTFADAKADNSLVDNVGGQVRIVDNDNGFSVDAFYKINAGHGIDNGGSVLNSDTGTLFHLVYNPGSKEISAAIFNFLADGSDEITQLTNFHDYLLANGFDSYWPPGIYDSGVASMPFRNTVTVSPSLVDYKGMTLRCSGGVTFRTTSVIGADVFQLNAIKNFNITGYPKITASISGSTSGSNAVSVTNGGRNIYVEANPFSMPGLDKTSFIDGGKAFTIQNGATALNDFVNICFKGKADDCAFLFEKSTPYDEFDIGVSPIYSGIKIDLIGENCWKGISMGASAATVAIAEEDRDCDIDVNAVLINCAQPVDLDRWVRSRVIAHIVNTKSKASLFRPLASDQTVFGCMIKGNYRSVVKITGTMAEVDNKLIIGGTSQGGGNFGGSLGLELDFELDAATVIGDEIDVVDFGGNTIKESTLTFADNVVASLPSPSDLLVVGNNNRVLLGSNLVNSFTATLTGCATAPTGSIEYSMNGDIVVMEIPQIRATSNSNFTTLTGVPTDVRPASAQTCICVNTDNSIDLISKLVVETDGTITLYPGTGLVSAWTASGLKGIEPITVTYRRT